MTLRFNTLNAPSPDNTYRVVQWATGKVGARSMRGIIRHPNLELVGLYVFSEAKEGRDAGELCNLDPIGIKATRNIDDIIALQPDCLMYMQEGVNADDLCRLLESGINVISTRSELFNPSTMQAELRERIETACEKGRSTLHSTGSSPGFITEAIPLALTSLARRLDCLTIDEFAYVPGSCSPAMVFDVMGYGRPPTEEFNPSLLQHMAGGFEQSLTTTANALSLPLDNVRASGETALATSRIKIADDAYIEPDTVAAQRITVEGMRNGKPLLRFRANWYCSKEIDRDWQLGDNGWRVTVEGDTPFDITMNLPRTDEPIADQMGGYTAHRAVNAIPAVCVADPGIATLVNLPMITATLA